jgi:hypothetical protein
MVESTLLPTYQVIDAGAIVAVFLIAIGVLRRLLAGEFPNSALRALRRTEKGAELIKSRHVPLSFLTVLFSDVTTIKVLRTCRTAKWLVHISIFWGFICLIISTTLAYFMKPEGTILPLHIQ